MRAVHQWFLLRLLGVCVAAAILAPHLAAAQATTIKIGVLTPLSGPAAYFGTQDKQGMELALQQAAADPALKNIHFDVQYQDDGCLPLPATQAVKRLLDEYHPDVVLGPECSDAALAVMPLLERAGVPMINAGATTNRLTGQGFKNVFRIVASASQQGDSLANHAYTDMGARTAALLYEKTNAGIDGADAFAAPFTKLGGKIVARIDFGRDVNDFTAIATRLSGLGAIDVLPTASLEGQGVKLTQALAQAGITKGGGGKAVQMGAIWLPYGFDKKAGPSATGYVRIVQFNPDDPRPIVAAFVRDFQAKFAGTPSHINAHAYDQVALVVAAARSGAKDAGGIRAALAGMHHVEVTTGFVDFDASGQNIDPSVMHYVQTQPDGSWIVPAWAK